MPRNRRQPSDHVTCRQCGREFRAISVLHPRNLHGYDGDDPVRDYKRRFRLQFVLCPDARRKLSRSKETFWASKGRHWTRTRWARLAGFEIQDVLRDRFAKNVKKLSDPATGTTGLVQRADCVDYSHCESIRHPDSPSAGKR
jgi:hypothetical protein